MTRSTVLILGAALLVGVSPFLPWLSVGNVGVPGIPDPAGWFVAVLGLVSLILVMPVVRRKWNTRPWIALAGLAATATLVVVMTAGARTVADRAQARAEAMALVDNVPMAPVPPVRTGAGLWVGLLGAVSLAAAGLAGVWRRDA